MWEVNPRYHLANMNRTRRRIAKRTPLPQRRKHALKRLTPGRKAPPEKPEHAAASMTTHGRVRTCWCVTYGRVRTCWCVIPGRLPALLAWSMGSHVVCLVMRMLRLHAICLSSRNWKATQLDCELFDLLKIPSDSAYPAARRCKNLLLDSVGPG